DAAYRLGILVDTDAYYRQPDVLERELMNPKLLEAFGWQIAHVLSKQWLEDRDRVLARLDERLKRASGKGDKAGWPWAVARPGLPQTRTCIH
ncbi:MAG TPA: hypothetical protein PK867_29325, partial [Pirellulales bacterium]|nr:hypothetical protein [Pirellulales bacterium]